MAIGTTVRAEVSVSGAARSPTRRDIRARAHTITMDEPEPRSGFDGVARVDKVFPEIDPVVDRRMRGAPGGLAPIQQELRERCPGSMALRSAGSEIREVWHVAR